MDFGFCSFANKLFLLEWLRVWGVGWGFFGKLLRVSYIQNLVVCEWPGFFSFPTLALLS